MTTQLALAAVDAAIERLRAALTAYGQGHIGEAELLDVARRERGIYTMVERFLAERNGRG